MSSDRVLGSHAMQNGIEELPLRRVRTFLDVAETLSVSETARRLGVTQPAVTQQIKALEASLGLLLFQRAGRALRLTESGRKIMPILRRWIAQHEHAIADMQEVVRIVQRELRIGISAPQTALPIAARFSQLYPNVRLSFLTANTETLVDKTESLDLDIAFVGMSEPLDEFHCQLLVAQHLVCLVPEDHAFAGRDSVSLREFANEPVVMREPGSFTGQLLAKALEDAGIKLKSALQVSSREAVHEAVSCGLGTTAVLHREVIRLPGLVSVPLENGSILGPEFVICQRELAVMPPVSMWLETCAQMSEA